MRRQRQQSADEPADLKGGGEQLKVKRRITAVLAAAACVLSFITGCTADSSEVPVVSDDSHLTVYLWQSPLVKNLVPYLKEQLPDKDIEYIVGNNNLDLYMYLEKHGDLPDIITTRRFSLTDAKALKPYLMDFAYYDIVSDYYPYALQYYTDSDGCIQWLPVCGIPETTIVNKTLLDTQGLKLPENYDEFAELCQQLYDRGIKPYVSELANDWAAHSLLQGAAIDRFSSLDGIAWRSEAESADGDIQFDDELWREIFAETDRFIKDTHLEADDINCDISDAREQFISWQAAMFRGVPEVMTALSQKMDAELVRLPYFSQTSDEDMVYTYPSLNIAFNKSLEDNKDKLDTALKLLDCMVSEQGQQLIANGSGIISYNINAESSLGYMSGIDSEIAENRVYIRYASNNSFAASLAAVQGLVSGEMDEEEAYDSFKEAINTRKADVASLEFDKTYDIGLNNSSGRDAASSILTTVRKQTGADAAFSSYYYYPSSVYEGSCTDKQLKMLTTQDNDTHLYIADLSGAEITELVQEYLAGGSDDIVSSRYELPVASGMKLSLKEEQNGYSLNGIEIDGKPIEADKTYKIMLTSICHDILEKLKPEYEAENIGMLSGIWTDTVKSGVKPSEPEDYIAVN